MENVILSPIPLEQLVAQIQHVVRQEINNQQALEYQEKLLSPKETCKLFNPSISIVTLNSWSNKGLITKHYIGGRTYYKQSEVLEASKTLKKYQSVRNV
ncbi:MAG TPA: hypothetical protein VEY51_20140 [Chondromyces sp.]|nr:hypothetical protein [Chondromyces sp.]